MDNALFMCLEGVHNRGDWGIGRRGLARAGGQQATLGTLVAMLQGRWLSREGIHDGGLSFVALEHAGTTLEYDGTILRYAGLAFDLWTYLYVLLEK